jgi:hypothetical protein
LEISSDSSPAKRSRAKPKVVAKAPAEAKPAAAKQPRTPRKSPTAKTTPAADVAVVAATLEPTAEDVGSMIATAAYYLAAARDFSPGHELDDWLEAERVVHAQLYG